jgi:hypothetical protein
MGWKAWAARIGGYAAAPWTGGASIAIGEGLAQGLDRHEAVSEAREQQQAGTDRAQQRLDTAQAIQGNVYNQQRQDYQSLANAPYQALGGLMGLSIPSIGPVAFAGQQSQTPGPGFRGGMNGLEPGTLQSPVDSKGRPYAPMDPDAPRAPQPTPHQTAKLQTLSSYASPEVDMVPMRTPIGKVIMVPRPKAGGGR